MMIAQTEQSNFRLMRQGSQRVSRQKVAYGFIHANRPLRSAFGGEGFAVKVLVIDPI